MQGAGRETVPPALMTKQKQMFVDVAKLLTAIAALWLCIAAIRSAPVQRAVIQNKAAQSQLRAVNEKNHDLIEENKALRNAVRAVSIEQ